MRGTIVFGVVLVALLCTGSASALDVVHDIGFTKTCATTTTIGDPYQCSYVVQNTIDAAHDTLTVNGLVDVVHSAGGDEGSGNVFGIIAIDNCTTVSGACTQSSATCTALFGTGTRANPWTSVSSCTLPFGSTLNFHSFSHYTVVAGDFGLPGHTLTDTASLTWHDLCDDPLGTGATNCVANPPDVSAQSSTTVQQLGSSTATQIHNAAHQVVTSAAPGDVVHDFVSVTGQSGKPNPTGNVLVERFANTGCSGTAANSTTVPLDASGQADATGFSVTVSEPIAFRATYLGDGTYAGSTGACEPLMVPDANIQLTPQNATNLVNTLHPLTCHINVGDGIAFTNAPAGTVCTASLLNSQGAVASFVGSNQCTTVLTTGSCQVVIQSSTAGTTAVHATTAVSVGGFVVTRATGDGHSGDSPDATKNWVTVTAVQVASLRATQRPAGVLIRWRMGSEAGVLGYNVYRERKGARIRLTRALVPARGGLAGRTYSYLDRSAPRARRGLRYWLQVVENDGSRVWKAVRVP
jgi:hypothetical protein